MLILHAYELEFYEDMYSLLSYIFIVDYRFGTYLSLYNQYIYNLSLNAMFILEFIST